MATIYNLNTLDTADTAPALNKKSFICPYPSCSANAFQYWHKLTAHLANNNMLIDHRIDGENILIAVCHSCKNASLWKGGELIYPVTKSNAPLPNGDLPEKALVNYKEAAAIFSLSPRAAAAMLRLAVQDICVHLGGKGQNMQADIDYLIKEKELPARLIKAMDAVRIVGNEAIHPGKMDLQDDDKTVGVLFGIVNYIAEKLITEPLVENKFYDDLPDSKKRKNIPEE